jgi:hypothetical protein
MLNNYLRSAALKPTLVLRDPQQAQRWTRRARGCSPISAPSLIAVCVGMADGYYF